MQAGHLHTAKIDALMHDEKKESPAVTESLRGYQSEVEQLLEIASRKYDEVRFCFFSDHGMCTVENVVDLMPAVAELDLEYGVDYVGIYDSTMMRFWFLRDGSEAKIRAALPDCDHGRWVTDDQHRSYGTYWPDGRFGDAVYALEPGVLLNPSHMGNVPLDGMHGYRPDHEDSYSSLIANFEPETPVERITDFYTLMREMATWAQSADAQRRLCCDACRRRTRGGRHHGAGRVVVPHALCPTGSPFCAIGLGRDGDRRSRDEQASTRARLSHGGRLHHCDRPASPGCDRRRPRDAISLLLSLSGPQRGIAQTARQEGG